MTTELVAMGLDPGLACTGYGIVAVSGQSWRVLSGGTIETSKEMTRAERLRALHDETRGLITEFTPSGIAIEEVFLATNARTAMLTAEARGALLVAAGDLPVRSYTPLQVKKRVAGYGKATKHQVQSMVVQLLGLTELPQPDDVADGIALAICYLRDALGAHPDRHDRS
ncbi:MAG: crossover junction endodeoxyribonuclease RuvC [Candidatus Bipolaricaulota bacterium]|nr:MAG: crossover junction endodeoxyribonuclease RuvC [Candidatus Bipolaricaulota bacterium]